MSGADEPGPIVVLEDDRVTAALTRRVLEAANVINPLTHFENGSDAAAFFEQCAKAGPMPVLVILDLGVPGLSGLDVLRHLRALPALANVPVVMLSGSGDGRDIEEAYDVGIEAYLVKPAGIHGLPDVIRRLALPHVLLPRPR